MPVPDILTKTKPLRYSFYTGKRTLDVASGLLGKHLVRTQGKRTWVGRIVETEAYIGETDPACHAFHGRTARTGVMYGPPGHAYVYFTYGMHFMLNIVTESEGFPAAVLIRALEPEYGFDGPDPRPASGPGKVCKAMRIDKKLNGISLLDKRLWIGTGGARIRPENIRWSARIGIARGQEKLWRAYLVGNPFVSGRISLENSALPSPV